MPTSLLMSSQNDAVAHGSDWILELMNLRVCFAFWWFSFFVSIASSSDVLGQRHREDSETVTEVFDILNLSKRKPIGELINR